MILCTYIVSFIQGSQSALSDGSVLLYLFLQGGETEAWGDYITCPQDHTLNYWHSAEENQGPLTPRPYPNQWATLPQHICLCQRCSSGLKYFMN